MRGEDRPGASIFVGRTAASFSSNHVKCVPKSSPQDSIHYRPLEVWT